MSFQIKDSGERAQFNSGMVRDVTTGKTDYSLVMDGPMFLRWAVHLTKGAIKYAKRNWMKANGQEEYDRFRESALRHFIQWYNGDTDEDHAAAVYFNVNGAEYVLARMRESVESGPAVSESATGVQSTQGQGGGQAGIIGGLCSDQNCPFCYPSLG